MSEVEELLHYKDMVERMTEKKPDYYYSFCGGFIYSGWYRSRGLTAATAKIIVIMGYLNCFYWKDFKFFGVPRITLNNALRDLKKMGYIEQIEMQSRSPRLRKAYVLTAKGRAMEADYEKYFNTYYDVLISKQRTKLKPPYKFIGDFERVRIPPNQRRNKQEHKRYGEIPGKRIEKWKDIPKNQ